MTPEQENLLLTVAEAVEKILDGTPIHTCLVDLVLLQDALRPFRQRAP